MVEERYLRQRLLGQGQMSAVWLAVDTHTQRSIALKIMTIIPEDDKRNQRAQERFHREIEIARGLQHPHILPIINYGYMQYEGRYVPFLVSPYIQEGSLVDLIQNRPPWMYWSLPQTADAIVQAADSLWYLHTRKPPIVHQDVKPGNFLFHSVQSAERAVRLYLCDFGISRWKQAPTSMASELLGTFAFMAPEQTERKVDCASDQYALAIMACYLLTGKLPLQAQTNELYIQAHLYDSPEPPSLLNSDRIYSNEIDAVILRALAKKPQQRYPTIMEFGQELRKAIMRFVQEQAQAQTQHVDIANTSTMYIDRNVPRLPIPTLDIEPEERIAIDPHDIHEGKVLDEPLPAKPLKWITPMRNEEITFTSLPLKGPVRFMLPARPKLLLWARAGRALACALYGHAPVYMYREREEGIRELNFPGAASATNLCWSPDGHTLLVSTQGTLNFWDTNAQTLLPLKPRFRVRSLEGVDWSINGQLAVWIEDQILVYTLPERLSAMPQLPAPQVIETGGMRCSNTGCLRWSPDGAFLAAGAASGEVACWSTARRSPVWRVAPAGQKAIGLCWSPDGTLLAAAFRDSRVVGWDVQTRANLFQWEKLPTMPRTLSISTMQHITIASSEQRLLLGLPDEVFPSTMLPGQLLAAWSPTHPELATLDEQRADVIVFWRA